MEQSEQINGYLKKPENIMLFHGSPGTGKTYLCSALIPWALERFNTFRYHREEDILRRLRRSINEGKGDYLYALEFLIDDEFIIVDDVGSGINPQHETNRDLEFRREVLFSLLDFRYKLRAPTVITSNFTQAEFEKVYSPRIASRLFSDDNTIVSVFDPTLDKRKQGF